MCLLGERRASKPSHSCSALAREEQVNCTSDAAGAFLGVFQMSWQLIIIWELQAVCPLLLSLGESSTRSARKPLIIGKEVRFVLVVACSDHLQPILNLTSGTIAQCWVCCCCVSGLTLVGGWGRSAHLGRLLCLVLALSGHTFSLQGQNLGCSTAVLALVGSHA